MEMSQIFYYRSMINLMKEVMDPDTPETRIDQIKTMLPAIESHWGGTDQIKEEILKRTKN